jgi:amidase
MSGLSGYPEYDGLGMAELVRSGHASAAELVDEAAGRIEARNPRVNAVVRRLFDRARAEVADRKVLPALRPLRLRYEA